MTIDFKLDDIVRKIVQIRDANKPCIIDGKPLVNPVVAHWQKRRHTQTRWHLSNVHLASFENNYLQECSSELNEQHSINVLEREGLEMYNKLINLRNLNFKFSKSNKEELLIYYKGLLKTMQ